MTRIKRTRTGAMRIISAVLVVAIAYAAAAVLPVRAETATPVPPHESPKTPKGNEGATAVIGLIALAFVGAGIAGGRAIERRQLAAPAPARTDGDGRVSAVPPAHAEPPAP